MNQSLDFAAVMKAAGIPEQGKTWADTWPDSEASFQLNDLYFFQPRWMEEALAKLKMPEAINAAFRQTLPFFAQHPALQRLAWHCCHLLYQTRFDPTAFRTWPPLPAALGPDAAMFYAFVCLAGLPQIERLHRQRGIDPAKSLAGTGYPTLEFLPLIGALPIGRFQGFACRSLLLEG